MKYIIIVLISLGLQTACKKADDNANCTAVTITNAAPGCGGWGIIVHGIKYPSENIPTEFQQDGLGVCAEYEFYQDMRMCACCGGTWANIKFIKHLGR